MSGVACIDRRRWWESIEGPIGPTEAVPASGTDVVTWRNGMEATDAVLEERIRRAVRCEIFRNCGERAVAGLVIAKLVNLVTRVQASTEYSSQMKTHVLLFRDVL